MSPCSYLMRPWIIYQFSVIYVSQKIEKIHKKIIGDFFFAGFLLRERCLGIGHQLTFAGVCAVGVVAISTTADKCRDPSFLRDLVCQ